LPGAAVVEGAVVGTDKFVRIAVGHGGLVAASELGSAEIVAVPIRTAGEGGLLGVGDDVREDCSHAVQPLLEGLLLGIGHCPSCSVDLDG